MLEFLLSISDPSEHEKIILIYEDYYELMLKYAVSKFKNIGRRNYVYDAEDAVQNSFMKITRYISNIDFSLGEKSVKNYVFSILSNEIYNFLNNNEEFDELDEEFCEKLEYDFLEELDIKERYNDIVKTIESLDEKYSTTLCLFYCQEMSVKEISDLMGISEKTVYTRISRGKIQLKNSLKGALIDE